MASARVRLTERDLRMFAFMAEHRMVLDRQVVALVGGSPRSLRERLSQLASDEYIAHERVLEDCCRIRSRGLAVIGSELRPPDSKLSKYWHDVGVAWLWLAAWRGAFGPVADVVGERRMRSHDESSASTEEPYSIRLGGYLTAGEERRHYPDLVLIDGHGRRLALELELSRKEVARREEILAGYGADRRLDGVLYLVEDHVQGRSIGRSIQATAGELGLRDRVHVRGVVPIKSGPAHRPAAAERVRRPAVREAGR